jgi:hypothetical protein
MEIEMKLAAAIALFILIGQQVLTFVLSLIPHCEGWVC